MGNEKSNSPFRAALSFEWNKLRTLRSTFWALAVYVALSVGFSFLWGSYARSRYEDQGVLEAGEAIQFGNSAAMMAMLAVVILSILAVTGEYGKGTISSSLTAVPKRSVLYGTKLLVNAAVAMGVSMVVVPSSFFITQRIIGSPAAVNFSDDSVVASIVGGVLYTTLMCVFFMGLATVVKNSIVTVGIFLSWTMMISQIFLSWSESSDIAQYFPDIAGLIVVYPSASESFSLAPWNGMLVLAGWAVASTCVGFWFFQRRDVS